MRLIPSRPELAKTVLLTVTILGSAISIAVLAFVSTLWSWLVLAVFGLLIMDQVIIRIYGTPQLYGRAYLRSYQWIRRNTVPLVTIAVVASILSLGMQVESRRKQQEAAKVRVCGLRDVENASKAVVLIEGKEGSGSGFWVGPSTVVTNNHVVDHNPDLRVNKLMPASILATDSLRDIALLRVYGAGWGQPQLVGADSPPPLADDLYVIGHPIGRNLTVSKGIVSAITSDDYDDRQFIQTDAAISPGNSGGPVVDRCGRVVGMATQTLRGAENVGYAIKWAQLSSRIAEMVESAESSTSEERELTYPSEQTEVVAKYYTTLGGGDLTGAYDFYSSARKLRLPFEGWSKGLGKTVFIRLVSVTPGEKSNSVKVHFYSTEEVEPGSWDWRTGEFEGIWALRREGGLWKMDESNIKDITKPDAQR